MLTEKICNMIVDRYLFNRESDQDIEEREVLVFGLTRILEDIPKYFLIIILSYFLNVIHEVALIFCITVLYKVFIGGAHAKTNLLCLLFSLAYFIAPAMIVKNIDINLNITYLMLILNYIISTYVSIYIAPADTESIPIINKKIRLRLKVLSFISLNALYLIAFININNVDYLNILNMVLIMVNFNASQLGYYIYDCKYGYKKCRIR